jgi:predicted DNA-binding protein
MCMSLDRRLQLLLDEERYARIAGIAQREQRSVASVIREAIDRHVGVTPDRRIRALESIRAASLMEVPDPVGLREELSDLRGRGL